MMKADMLYQLDLRLRELKEKPDLPFGGVSIFLFGDILQLRPVRARYIFEEPICESFALAYLLGSLWKTFDVVMLRHNHRQGEDGEYAETLNRIRIGDLTENDIKMLETRVRPSNHPDIPSNALVVTCTNKEVNQINDDRLELVEGEEHVIESLNRTSTKTNFKPRTDASGAISGTPLQKKLKLKVSAKVMLTYNIDTCDCLTNGAFGEVLGFKLKKDKSVEKVYVQFYDEDVGRERRKNHVAIQNLFPGKKVTPIELIEFEYSLAKKKNGSTASATAMQFPLRLAFAATAHKVQGQTVKKPNNLVVDLRTVRESAQAYVILSRVQALSQLFILESVCADKIRASTSAMEELDKMEENAKQNQDISMDNIISCNIRSVKKNFGNFSTGSFLRKSAVVCLQETWLDPSTSTINLIDGWQQHSNSVGKGRGIITCFKSSYIWEKDVNKPNYQMTKISSESEEIINIYRSADANNLRFIEDLTALLDKGKDIFILGDFNICYARDTFNEVFTELRRLGFRQLVKRPTHIEGGMIDLVFLLSSNPNTAHEVRQQAQFFTDHDVVEVLRGKNILF